MVHALHGVWRVLAERATLVDLRPLPSQWAVETVSANTVVQIGEVDGTGKVADDAAADDAIREAVDHGWFVPRRETRYDFEFYWNSVAEMSSFLQASKRVRQVVPSYADLEKVHRDLSAHHGAGVRLRCRRRTILVAYEKATPRVVLPSRPERT
jgi:hypothetical protein